MIDKHKIIVNIDGKKYEIPLPKDSGLEVRETQDSGCNSKGCICGLFRSQLVCLKLNLKPDENGNLDLCEMRACSKNPDSPKIKVSD